MKKQLLISMLLLFSNEALRAQDAPSIEWQKSLGGTSDDAAYCIQQTSDGGFIVAARSGSNDGDVSGNHGDDDYWIVKIDSSGNIQWQKSLGGSYEEGAHTILQTSDGGYLVSGYTRSGDGDISVNYGFIDDWIVKLDPVGNIQWQKSLGGSNWDGLYSTQQTADGGYIVAGFTNSDDGIVVGNPQSNDFWILKLDSSGNIQWQKLLGGSVDEQANCIRNTTDGGFIVAGSSSSNDGDVSGNHGDWDEWIVKLDSLANIQWQKSLGGTAYDGAYSIQQTIDGGFIVAGSSDSNDGDVSGNHGYGDCWIVKLDAAGNIQWQKSLGGSQHDVASSIQQTADGGYIIAGGSSSNDGDVTGNHGFGDYWIVKIDSSGNIEWQKCLGGSSYEAAYSIQQATDGGFIVAGYSPSLDGDVSGNHGYEDCWIVKLSANPSTTCYTTFTLVADSSLMHHYWLVPFIDADPPVTYLWNWGDGTTDTSAYPTHIYAVGGFYSICLYTVDSGACSDSNCIDFNLQKLSQENTIVKVDVVDSIPSIPTTIQKTNVLQSWSVFPNPAAGNSFIRYTLSTPATVSIALYDVLGNKLQQLVNGEQEQGEHNATIDAHKLVNGVYVLQILAGDQMAEQKIAVIN